MDILEQYNKQNSVHGEIPQNVSEGLPCSGTVGIRPWLSNVCSVNDSLGFPYAYYVLAGNQSYRLGARFELPANRGAAFTRPCCGVLADYYEVR